MTAKAWQKVSLGSVCDVIPGYAFKSQDLGDEGIPVVKIGDITENLSVDVENCDRISQDLLDERMGGYLLEDKDILLAMTGATAGKIGRVRTTERALLNQRVAKIKARRADEDYVWFVLSTPIYREVFYNLGRGAAQPNISGGQIESTVIPLPPPLTQKRIASILSAYDDLIENNLRRVKLLEESARLLYEEWFVRLRFPGHEHVRIVKGVPDGWNAQILDDLCRIGRGASPRPIAAFMGGDVPWFKIADATASESPFIFETKERVIENGAKKSIMLEPGSLILSNSATCGIPYFTAVAGCIHDSWLHFAELKRISREFLYCFLEFKRDELVSNVGDGSTQKNLNTSAVGRLKVTIPRSDSLLSQFDEAVAPMFSLILKLATQNQRLRTARDILLPKLMSGEIEV